MMTYDEAIRKTIFREAADEISRDLSIMSFNAGVGGKLPKDIEADMEKAIDRIVYSAQVLIGENGRGNVITGAWDPERDEDVGRAVRAKQRRDSMRLVA